MSILPLPPLSTPIVKIEAQTEYKVLIKRLERVLRGIYGAEVYFGDLLSLNAQQVALAPGIGQKLVDQFKDLKAREVEQVRLVQALPLEEMQINWHLRGFPSIQRLAALMPEGRQIDIGALLDMDFTAHQVTSDDTPDLRRLLSVVGYACFDELQRMLSQEINLLEWDGEILIPADDTTMPVSLMESYLVEDLQAYLSTLNDRNRDIFSRRFGLGQPPEKAAEVAVDYGFSKQRVDKLKIDALCRFKDQTRISETQICALIDREIMVSLPEKMPRLLACFGSRAALYGFLRHLSGRKMQKSAVGLIGKKTLSAFFEEQGVAVSIETACTTLASAQPNRDRASLVLERLEAEGRISVNHGQIQPAA